MTRILAIEPDSERGALLQRLVRQALDADVVLAVSTDAAMALMAEEAPDLILASTLLTPKDEQALVAHLRGTPALGHVPILTIPPVAETPEPRARVGLMSQLLRRKTPGELPYDFSYVAGRIEEALQQSRIDAAATVAPLTRPVDATHVEWPASDEHTLALCGLGPEHKRAQRWTNAQLPWLSSVKLSWGLELRLLNISSTGVLVESGLSLSPGSTTTFQLTGPNQDMVVRGRVVRNRVATVSPLGVKYHAAAVFDEPFDALAAPDDEPLDPEKHLANLVATVREQAVSGAHPADLRAEFEAGVLELINAQDVRLRDVPVVENNGRESVYFTIPSLDGSAAVLQVTFEPDYEPSADEFEALKSAADAAAKVLQLTDTTRQVSVPTKASRRINGTLRLVSSESSSRRELRPTA